MNANVVFHSSKSQSIGSVASKNAFAVFDTAQLYFKYYVIAFLRSHIGLNQIVMYQSGTTYPTVSEADVEKIRILFIPEDQMEVVNRDYKKYVEIKLIEEFTTKAILELIQDEIESVDGVIDDRDNL